jgi:hypothetical protein
MADTQGKIAAFIYLLSLLGVSQAQITDQIKAIYGYAPEPRNVFTPRGTRKLDDGDLTGKLLETVDDDMIESGMRWLGMSEVVEDAASYMSVDAKALWAIVKDNIEALRKNPNPAFYRFCYLIDTFNRKMTAKRTSDDLDVTTSYFKDRFGLGISSLQPTSTILSVLNEGDSTGMRITVVHNRRTWRARYLSFSEAEQTEEMLDVGKIVNAVAVGEFLGKFNNVKEGTTIWNGTQTRVCSCTKDFGEAGRVLVNTCETDYISLLATNYGLLKGSGHYRGMFGTPTDLVKSQKMLQSMFQKQEAALQKNNEEQYQKLRLFVMEADRDLYEIQTWNPERLSHAFENIDAIAREERQIPIFGIGKSLLANCMSVNVAYRHNGKIYIQRRGQTGHGRVKFQISAAGFVELPQCCTNLPNDRTPDIMKAVHKESMEELLKRLDLVVLTDTMSILGIVRDDQNCEVGVLVTADISPKYGQKEVLGDVPELGSEVAGYLCIDADPISMYRFILRSASCRGDVFKPWNDMMPLGSAALLFAMIRWHGDELVRDAYRMIFAQVEKEKGLHA